MLQVVVDLMELDKPLTTVDRDSFPDIDTFLNLRGTNERTLQGIFSDAVVKSKVKLFKEHILSKDRHEYAWFVSAACPESGRWLTVVPKITRGKQFRFSNVEFSTALRLRRYMDQKRIIPGSVCNCSTQRQRVTLDLKGHHVASGCRLDGVRQATHDGGS